MWKNKGPRITKTTLTVKNKDGEFTFHIKNQDT